MSINKVRIDAPAGIVEVEGEKDFVEEQVDKILPIIQAAGFGANARRAQAQAEEVAERTASGDSNEEPEQAAKKRRKIVAPPKGQSCRDRIKVLKGDDFFKQQRTPSDIVEGLGKKGWTHNGNQVGATLTQMFEKGELQRTKDGGNFKYFWDRV